MSDRTPKNPLIKQGWLRVVLFAAGFGIITLLVAIPAVIAVAGVKKDDLLATPITTIKGLLTGDYLWLMVLLETVISLVSVSLFRVFIDRRGWKEWGLDTEGFGIDSLLGLLLAPALLGLGAILLLLSGHLQWVDMTPDATSLFLSFGLLVLIAFSEECVFRGYILQNLLEFFSPQDPDAAFSGSSQNPDGTPAATQSGKWVALLISAILFAAFHCTNPGIDALALVNLLLAGILLGLNYIYTRNLWFSILLHLGWNFFQGPVLGFRVSGVSLPTLLQMEVKGEPMITGAAFGLEGSIVMLPVFLIAIILLAWAFERRYNPGTNNRLPQPANQ